MSNIINFALLGQSITLCITFYNIYKIQERLSICEINIDTYRILVGNLVRELQNKKIKKNLKEKSSND